MKAARIEEYGGVDVLSVQEVDKPLLRPGQILVEVRAASLNPFDTALREGKFRDSIKLKLPVVAGGDFSGVIIEKNKDVDGFRVGDRVYGQAAAVAGNSGAFAQYTATASHQVALVPSNLNYEEAASLPMVGVSALQALTEHLSLQPGQNIFINGSGGIGIIAIQIARHIGARVTVSTRKNDSEYLTKLGADSVVDSNRDSFMESLQSYDAVFDTAGRHFTELLDILREGGKAVSMAAQADQEKALQRNLEVITQSTKVNTDKLDKLRELVERGVVEPQVHAVFALAEVREAFRTRENERIRGKIVLKINYSLF
jgi:alcohol dehydrogenase